MWFHYSPRGSLSEQLQDVPGSPAPAQLTHPLICHFPALLQFLSLLLSHLKTTVTNETFFANMQIDYTLYLFLFCSSFFFFFSFLVVK